MRPSENELNKKIKKAIELIDQKKRVFIDEKVSGELDDIDDMGVPESEIFELIKEFLNEIRGYGALNCWAGAKPPQKSYEKKIQGCDLWAFKAHCSRVQKVMYLKFAIKKDQLFVYVSFHKSRERK